MRAVICGAGIAGLALAQRLADDGCRVTVVERHQGPRAQGYMLDFWGLGYDAAERMGVLPRLLELRYPVDAAEYVDASGRRRGRIDYSRFVALLHGRLLSLMRPDLEQALREQVEGRVDLRFGYTVTGVDQVDGGVRVSLSDAAGMNGAVLDADLLVGADGVHSTVRQMVFGDEAQFIRYLGFHTAAYVFEDPDLRRDIGNRFSLTDSVDRMMGVYGLRDGRVAAFAVHREPDPALPADPRSVLRERYESLGWLVPRVLDGCPPGSELYYDQVAQVEVPQWHRGRVVLLGDACQAVSLLAGQGASLAVAAAVVLAEQIASAPSLDDGLERYERIWAPLVAERQAAGRRGTEWFLPSSRSRLWIRRAALRTAALPGWSRVVAHGLVGKSNLRIEDVLAADPDLANLASRA
ncbi:MAG: FAD-dependent monooxygenase [Actinomycetes bacterium]